MSAPPPPSSAAGSGGTAAGDDGEVTVLLGLNQAPSMNSVLRALKREESSLFSCVASIADDAQFVEQVAARYPGLPLLPNLRCGVWYVRPPLGAACYFKSTDGHNNNWSFSTVRLNLGVAEAAAKAGGCVIVDATRRGKRFPDAMSKTIPMWCAVLNRAIHRLRQQTAAAAAAAPAAAGAATRGTDASTAAAAPAAEGPAAAAAAAGEPLGGVVPWDCDLHLPPWVSDVERNSIQQRLDGWVDDLFGLKPDLSALCATLAKPLRCLWVSQDSRLWLEEGQAVDVASLHFTPIVLVNASASATRERRYLTLPPEAPGEEPMSISYSYCPGAADDEESWACGLSPELMWRHLRALLAAGPGGIEAAVCRLLAGQQRQLEGAAAGATAGAAAGTTAPAGPAGGGSARSRPQTGETFAAQATARAAAAPADGPCSQPAAAAVESPGKAAVAALPAGGAGPPTAGLQQQLGAGQHCLLPRGCLPSQSAAVQQLGAGMFLLGGTGLALGSAAAAAAPLVWQHVDAVLHLGLQPVAGMQQERQWYATQAAAAVPAGTQAAAHREAPSAGCRSSSGPQQEAAELRAAAPAAPADPAACRYCWLHVRSSKEGRHSLEQHLPAVLAFARAQLARRRRLLLCCDSGLDASVCAAVACLLAFFRLEERPGAGGGLLPVWASTPDAPAADDLAGGTAAQRAGVHASVGGTSGAAAAEQPNPPATLPPFPPVAGAAGFDKLAVRQHLGVVSAHYPAGRPTRGMLKQVYNFFLCQL